jgi:hypothetical protein
MQQIRQPQQTISSLSTSPCSFSSQDAYNEPSSTTNNNITMNSEGMRTTQQQNTQEQTTT